MRTKSFASWVVLILTLTLCEFGNAQQSAYYQKAKDLCLQAAAKTKCPEKAAHFRKMANYNQCMVDQLAGKKVTCTEVTAAVPVCEADQVGSGSSNLSSTSNAAVNKVNGADPAKIGAQLNSIGTILDSNSSQANKNDALDLLLGNPVGSTNTGVAIIDLLEGKQKKENFTAELSKSYKKLKYLFTTEYKIDYDEYISSIIKGDYDKWISLYKPSIDINMILIHNVPPSFENVFLGNVALVCSYYGNVNFLQKLLTDYPNVALNYHWFKKYYRSDALEAAMYLHRFDMVKLLLENGAAFIDSGPKASRYENIARGLGDFEIADLIKEHSGNKERTIRKPIDEAYVGWEDKTVKYLLKESRAILRYDRKLLEKPSFAKEENKAPSTQTNQTLSIADEIKKLKELLDSGIITKDEFEAAKKKLIEGN